MNRGSSRSLAPGRRCRQSRVQVTMTVLDYFLALLSGALLALSFPRFGHPAFAWIALVPLLIAVSGPSTSLRARPSPSLRATPSTSLSAGHTPLRTFTLVLVSGIVYFVGNIYWNGAVLRAF